METIAGNSSVIHPVVAKVRLIEEDLNGYLISRRAEIRGAFLALAAKQHVFYLGSPGSGKSYLVTEVARRLRGAPETFFLIEFNPFILREELFGPISLREMREHDSLARKYKGFLPSATVLQLDELWKAPPSLLNTLLRILNEREFRNDTEMVRSPLVSAFATSNELPPTDRSLDALYDRILLRYETDPLRRTEDRKKASTLRLSKRAFESTIMDAANDLARVRDRRLAESLAEITRTSATRLTEAETELKTTFGLKLRAEEERIKGLPGPDQDLARRQMRDGVRHDLLTQVNLIRADEASRAEGERAAAVAKSAAAGLPSTIAHADNWLIDNLGEYFSKEESIRGIADETSFPPLAALGVDTPDVRELLKRVARWAGKHNYIANYRGFIDERDLATLYGLVLTVTFPEEVEAAFYRILDKLPNVRSVRRETDLRLVIAAQAVLEGRSVAAIEDLSVMKHVLWDRREEQRTVNEYVNNETIELEHELEALKQTIAAWEHQGTEELDVDYNTYRDKMAQREHELDRYKTVLEAHPENAEMAALLAHAEQLYSDYQVAIVGRLNSDVDPLAI